MIFTEAAERWVKQNVGNPRAWFAHPLIQAIGAIPVEAVDVPQMRDELNAVYAEPRERLAAGEVLVAIPSRAA